MTTVALAKVVSRIAVAWLVFCSSVLAQPAALRIVVIEGEDGVNVIQQKTAVRPVVEVRDRNNLPVSGVLVTFSIEGGKAASFGGASTLTVATNAAGQAAVSGLTPTAAGAFQIQVQAAFQGQIATATIAQTNVMTAAQAAAAAGASGANSAGGASGAGAGGAGGGGGLSATTIGVVGAAVAGGALAAMQINKEEDEGDRYTGTVTGQLVNEVVGAGGAARCSFTRAITLNLTLTLDVNTETSVRGILEVTGSDTVIAQTCSGPRPATPLQEQFDVTGTRTSFGFQHSRPFMQTGDFGTTTGGRTILFNASLNGEAVNGTFKVEERYTTVGGSGGDVFDTASATFPISLRKSS